MNQDALSPDRRRFLKLLGIGGLSAAALPLVRPALADATSPRRAIFVYIPNGCNPNSWHPTGTETNFQLPTMTQPLERVKQHCVFLQGIEMYGSGGTHEGGMRKVLTGGSGHSHGLGASLDVYLGNYFRNQSQRPFLNLGVIGNEWSKPITYGADGSPIPTEDNPLAVFETLFGSDAGNQSQNTRRLSVIDNALNEVNQLKARLGTIEREKLDYHLESLRTLERRLSTGDSGATCDTSGFNQQGFMVTSDAYGNEYMNHANAPIVGALQTDIAVRALACNLTRVVTLKWAYPVTPLAVPESGSSKPCHQASHDFDSHFDLIKAWFVDRFAILIEQLATYPDGNGTLLDNTVLFLCSELGHSSWHNHVNMPFVLAGGRAGGIQTGRYLTYNNAAHNKILVSIAQFMGVPINQFGNTDDTPGELPGLMG